MGIFDAEAFDETPTQRAAEYLRPGDHVLEVERHKYLEERDAFVAELKVISSKDPEGNPCHPVGATISYFVGNGGFKMQEANRKEIKNYVCAVLNVPDVTQKQVMGTTTDEGQELVVGKRVRCNAYLNKSQTYTKKKWFAAA